MGKESKQERLVSLMQGQVTEHMHQLSNLVKSPSVKEIDIERWCERVLGICLGYSATDGFLIKAQESKGKHRPDLTVYKNDKAIFVVEVKKLGFDLDKSDFRSGVTQLSEYLSSIGGVRWGILSNGYEWRLYDFSYPEYKAVEVKSIDLLRGENDTLDLSKKIIEEICWDFLDLHENFFSSGTWDESSREAMAFSPESIAKAILSFDAIKYIAKNIRGEHDYKVNIDILFDKVFTLLANGLDDSVSDWNETKELELKKFIKSQKKISRNIKKQKKATTVPSVQEEQKTVQTETQFAAVSNDIEVKKTA